MLVSEHRLSIVTRLYLYWQECWKVHVLTQDFSQNFCHLESWVMFDQVFPRLTSLKQHGLVHQDRLTQLWRSFPTW